MSYLKSITNKPKLTNYHRKLFSKSFLLEIDIIHFHESIKSINSFEHKTFIIPFKSDIDSTDEIDWKSDNRSETQKNTTIV